MLVALLWNLLLSAGLALIVASLYRSTWMQRRPALTHALWLLVLAKLVTPPLVSLPLLPASRAEEISSSRNVHAEQAKTYEATIPLNWRAPNAPGEDVSSMDRRGGLANAIGSFARLRWLEVAIVLSLIGTAGWLCVHVLRGFLFTRWLRRAGEPDDRLATCCAEVANELGLAQSVDSQVVDAPTTPLLWGLWRPTVVLNRKMLAQLSNEQLKSIVAHELAHVSRYDNWANLFAFSVKSLFWWNPIAWWAHREVRAAQELCCDSIAISVSSRSCYAETLLHAVDFTYVNSLAQRELMLAMGAKSSIVRRFEMIADSQLSHHSPRGTLLLLAVLLTAMICTPVRGRADQATAKDETAAPPTLTNTAPQSPLEVGENAATKGGSDEEADAKRVKGGGETTPEAKSAAPPQSAGDNPKHVFLAAVVFKDNKPQAWLIDRVKNKRTRLGDGDRFHIGARMGEVIELGNDSMKFASGGASHTWKLGKSLADIESLASMAAKPEPNKEKRFEVQVEMIGDNLIVRGSQEDVARISKLLERISLRDLAGATDDELKNESAVLRSYALGQLGGELVKGVLHAVLGDERDCSIGIDEKAKKLVVVARPQSHEKVKKLLDLLTEPIDTKPEGPKFTVSFKQQPWQSVLEWYCDSAGLSLSFDEPVSGTFTFRDAQPQSLTEIFDILNRALITRDRVLIRNDNILTVADLEPALIRELAPRVSVKQLANRGRFEYVKVLFSVDAKDAEAMQKEVTPLLSRAGSVVVLPRSGVLVVTERAGAMQTINEIVLQH